MARVLSWLGVAGAPWPIKYSQDGPIPPQRQLSKILYTYSAVIPRSHRRNLEVHHYAEVRPQPLSHSNRGVGAAAIKRIGIIIISAP